MKVLLFIILFIIGIQNLSSRTIKEYVYEIDTIHSDNFEPLIGKLLNDDNKHTIAGYDYSTSEYIFQGLVMSDNPLTCNRLKFVEQMSVKLKMLKCHPNINGLIAYFNNDLQELEQIDENKKKVSKNSFLECLIMTLQISKMKIPQDSTNLTIQMDSIYDKYTSLPNEYSDLRLLLPLNELFIQIKKQLSLNEIKSLAINWISTKNMELREQMILTRYCEIIDYYNPKCISIYNFDTRKLAFCYSGNFGSSDFFRRTAVRGSLDAFVPQAAE